MDPERSTKPGGLLPARTRTLGPQARITPWALITPQSVAVLQRLAGNRATASALEKTATTSSPRIQRQFYGPPSATGAGSGFDDFLLQFNQLEGLAITEGYSLTQRVTAFRKVFYDSTGPAKSYAGVTTGGGAWNILIPGAAATGLPSSWADPLAAGAVAYLRGRAVQTINGMQVDVGHLLAGADARNHPTSISLPGVTMRSNVEATTFTGDLGSVVVEYMYRSTRSFRDTAMVLAPSSLVSTYDAFASPPDMRGDADALTLHLDTTRTLGQNLADYYTASSRGSGSRWKSLGAAIGLGAFSGGQFPGNTPAWHTAMQGEIMNAALAYAAANGHRADVVNVNSDPGPGIFAPTFWEAYWNVSGWVLDEFLHRLTAGAAAEP